MVLPNPKLLRRCDARFRQVTVRIGNELCQWWRALLQCIPGEIGCFARGHLYGFRIGRGTRVLRNVVVYYPRNLSLGANVGIAAGCQFNAGGRITIADNVLIGPGCIIWSQNHRYESPEIPINQQGYEREEVRIDEDVWIGAHAVVLPGVQLGRGTVVAAGAVVTKSTSPNSIVGGVPARVIGRRGDHVPEPATGVDEWRLENVAAGSDRSNP